MATEYIVKEKSPLIDFTNELIDKKVSPIEDTVKELQKRVEEGGTSGGGGGKLYKKTYELMCPTDTHTAMAVAVEYSSNNVVTTVLSELGNKFFGQPCAVVDTTTYAYLVGFVMMSYAYGDGGWALVITYDNSSSPLTVQITADMITTSVEEV